MQFSGSRFWHILPFPQRLKKGLFLIHSADPLFRPVEINIIVHVYVRPHFSKYRKTKQTSLEHNDRYRWDCGSGRRDHWRHMSFFHFYPGKFALKAKFTLGSEEEDAFLPCYKVVWKFTLAFMLIWTFFALKLEALRRRKLLSATISREGSGMKKVQILSNFSWKNRLS